MRTLEEIRQEIKDVREEIFVPIIEEAIDGLAGVRIMDNRSPGSSFIWIELPVGPRMAISAIRTSNGDIIAEGDIVVGNIGNPNISEKLRKWVVKRGEISRDE
jgi:hypothetical protein